MQFLKPKSSKKERKQYIDQNPLEIIAGGLKTSVVDDLGKASINEAWKELLGKEERTSSSNADHGVLSEGTELDLAKLQEKAHEITEAGREYASEIIHAGKKANAENSQEMQIKMQEILIEIKKLSESSSELQQQVEIIAIEQTGENVGIYHLNYLEKMLSFIHELRMNVDDSLAWFGALRSKKSARQYDTMAKKHGTSFTLSNERQVATQVG